MAMAASPCLLLVGTYGEKLGHVDGKGKGVYVFLLDRQAMRLMSAPPEPSPPMPFLGTPQLGGASGVLNPTYLTSYRDVEAGALHVYIADELYSAEGGRLVAATLDERTAELVRLGEPAHAGGTGTCHVAVASGGKHVLAANYMGGTVTAVERRLDGSLGAPVALIALPLSSPVRGLANPISFPGAHRERQEQAHPHMVKPCGAHTVLVPDLGSDCVWNLKYEPTAPVPLEVTSSCGEIGALHGAGPRHVAVHPLPEVSVAYVAYELTSQVAAFALDDHGALTGEPLSPGPVCVLPLGEQPTAKGPFNSAGDEPTTYRAFATTDSRGVVICRDKDTSVAAVRVSPAGDYLYVSSRIAKGTGVISSLKLLPDGRIVPPSEGSLGVSSTHGCTPRDFVLLPTADPSSDRYVALIANQESGRTCVVARVRLMFSSLADQDSTARKQDSNNLVVLSSAAPPCDLAAEVPTPVAICVVPELVLDA